MSNEEARRRLRREIEFRPVPKDGQRLLQTCHEWPLIDNQKLACSQAGGCRCNKCDPSGWKTIKNATRHCTEQNVRDILTARGVNTEEKNGNGYRYFVPTFLFWRSNDRIFREKIMSDFACGMVCDVDIESSFHSPPPDYEPEPTQETSWEFESSLA